MKAVQKTLDADRKKALADPEIKKAMTQVTRLENATAKQKRTYQRTYALAMAQSALGREAAYKKLSAKAFQELDKLTALRTKLEVAATKVKFKFLEKFEIPVKNQAKLDYDNTGHNNIDRNMRQAFKTLERHMSPNVHGVVFEPIELKEYVGKYWTGEEAKAMAKSGRSFVHGKAMALSKDATPITIIHEFGHVVEDNIPNARRMSQGFLQSRVGDEPLTNLRQRYGDMYGSNEVGRKDQFDKAFGERSAHYVGKQYKDGTTEVFSMGVEKFFTDPIKFAKADPEYFNFVVGMMHGDFQ